MKQEIENLKAQLATAEADGRRMDAELAMAKADYSAIYQRVSRMTTLEGEARETGGLMAMLDEISERAVSDYERAEKAEARVKELERGDEQTMQERDDAEDVIAKLCKLIGFTPEWSSAYDYPDALIEAEERMVEHAGQSDRLKALTAECTRLAKREAELTFELGAESARLRAVTEAILVADAESIDRMADQIAEAMAKIEGGETRDCEQLARAALAAIGLTAPKKGARNV